MSAHVSVFHCSPTRWWTSGRSPKRAACPKNTPTVVRSAIPSGFSSVAGGLPDVPMDNECLSDGLDRQRQAPRGHADRNPVTFLLSHQRPPDRRVHRDSSRRRVALDRAHQVIRLGGAVVVGDIDGRSRPGDARMRFLDDLGAADHLLELVDAAVEETYLFLRLLILGVVLDISRLEGLLQALAGIEPTLQRDLEVALELLQPLRSQQNRFG